MAYEIGTIFFQTLSLIFLIFGSIICLYLVWAFLSYLLVAHVPEIENVEKCYKIMGINLHCYNQTKAKICSRIVGFSKPYSCLPIGYH